MNWAKALDKYAGKQIGCHYCANEPEPGWIETDNGPIVNCPVCNDGPNKRPRTGRLSPRAYREKED